MTAKTKIFFLLIVGIAGLVIGAILLMENMQIFTLPTRGGVNVDITVAVSPQLEDWVRDAALDFNGRNSQVTVTIVSLKGLDAPQRLDLSKGDTLYDAWIAEADFVRQMARSVPYDQQGTSVAQTGLIWLSVAGRASLPGNPDWGSVHDVAQNNAQFRVALTSPRSSVEGLATYLSAAAAYHNRPTLDQNAVVDTGFARWMDEILIAVPDKNGDPVNQLTRTPPSVDVGMVLQSELGKFNLSQFTQQIPVYNVIFNFPYLIRRGSTAPDAVDRERGAEIFRDFLLSAEQQNRLPATGLRPAQTLVSGETVKVDGTTAERLWSKYR